MLVEEEDSAYMADNDGDSDEARTLRPLQAAACTYRIAIGLYGPDGVRLKSNAGTDSLALSTVTIP